MSLAIADIASLPFRLEKEKSAGIALFNTKKYIIDENPLEHFCVYTLPYFPQTQEVLLGHHKKADKWLVPGGHIDPKETITQTAVREVKEELGLTITSTAISQPFFVDITNIISKPPRQCKTHYSIWVYFSSDKNTYTLDPSEFYESGWFPLIDAVEKTTDQANKDALRKFTKMMHM